MPNLNSSLILAQNLLDWYDKNHRILPWRAPLGQPGDPYGVWVSEIMLQQTTVPTVKDYYIRFMTKWPTLPDFSSCHLDELLHLWQGLGYYSRARNMHACAQKLMTQYGGQFPQDESNLLTLPGIGPYTAAAISAIAFNQPAAVVDGNIERVISRVFNIQQPLPQSKSCIKDYVRKVTPLNRPGDFAQAMMDLGSGICTPTSPKCTQCPLQGHCEALKEGTVLMLPRKLPKIPRPIRYGYILWHEDDQGRILLERRPDKGLLAKMTGFPTSAWESELPQLLGFLNGANHNFMNVHEFQGNLEMIPGQIKHVFTHFTLYLYVVRIYAPLPPESLWATRDTFHEHALPTLMKKVCKHVGN